MNRPKGKGRTRRPAPVPTSVGQLGYSSASCSSADIASASPSHKDGTGCDLAFQVPLPEVSMPSKPPPPGGALCSLHESPPRHQEVCFSRMSQTCMVSPEFTPEFTCVPTRGRTHRFGPYEGAGADPMITLCHARVPSRDPSAPLRCAPLSACPERGRRDDRIRRLLPLPW